MSLFGSTRKVAVSLGLMALFVVCGMVGTASAQEPQKVRVLLGRSAVLSVPDSIGTVSIADDEIADVVVATSRQLLLNAKKIGTTTLVVWSKGNRYQTFEVVVHSGTGFNQVVLNVKIAEVSRSRLKQLGFDFFVNMLNSRRLEGSGTIGFFGGQVNTPRIPILQDPLGEQVGIAIDYASLSGDRHVQGIVKALESDGTIKTLASPNLVAVNGEKAKFLSGGEIPIPVVQSGSGDNSNCPFLWTYPPPCSCQRSSACSAKPSARRTSRGCWSEPSPRRPWTPVEPCATPESPGTTSSICGADAAWRRPRCTTTWSTPQHA